MINCLLRRVGKRDSVGGGRGDTRLCLGKQSRPAKQIRTRTEKKDRTRDADRETKSQRVIADERETKR